MVICEYRTESNPLVTPLSLDQVHSIFVKFGFDKIARVRTYYISAYI